MTTREALMIVCIAGVAVTGLIGSLVFSDLLNEVKGLLPGDKEYYLLHFQHPFPWDFKFWREVMVEHRSKFPGTRRVGVLKSCYILMALFILGLAFCTFALS